MNEESNAFGQETALKENASAFCCQFVSSDGSFEPHPPIGSPITVCFYEFVFGAVDKEKFDVFSVKADGGYSFTFYESRVPRGEKEKFFFLLCDLAVSLGKLRTQFADFCFEGVPLRNEAAFFANRLSELNGVCREALRRIELFLSLLMNLRMALKACLVKRSIFLQKKIPKATMARAETCVAVSLKTSVMMSGTMRLIVA